MRTTSWTSWAWIPRSLLGFAELKCFVRGLGLLGLPLLGCCLEVAEWAFDAEAV
ncbi:hypothetical protein HanXRQr2_Chr13g0576061 [Helianthus annuus]|uniref:Uncharacterized protein n=1 Tax=Helianthus annuus TaxID=4232 RepID=A0A251SPC0_HELAN|nr:hypothetical protein HanXRQr2_Chr13g0576061 [Helianthus annuus]